MSKIAQLHQKFTSEPKKTPKKTVQHIFKFVAAQSLKQELRQLRRPIGTGPPRLWLG